MSTPDRSEVLRGARSLALPRRLEARLQLQLAGVVYPGHDSRNLDPPRGIRECVFCESGGHLRDLRKALHHTQVDIARKMKVGQDTVSRYEQRTDMMLSTLERYVSAMGGTLTLVAEFPDREPVRVRTLGELSDEGAEVTPGMLARRRRQTSKRAARR